MCHKGCCKYCCVFILPILIALQLGGWQEQPTFVRQVGKTDFARPENYERFILTDQHREEFFRDGATFLKGVLKPEVVKKLYDLASQVGEWDSLRRSNTWMLSDEVLDFYLFGPLGDIAVQVFQSPQAATADLPPTAQLQRDFISMRQHNATNGWHIDRTECQVGDQPSRYLSTALARLALPLFVDGALRGTQIINQSKYAAAMPEAEREEYFAGRAMYRKEGRFERLFLWDTDMALPVLPGLTLNESMIMEFWMEPGDIILFNTCLWHRSPPWAGGAPEIALQPTFAPSNHISRDPPTWSDTKASWCLNGLEGKAIGEEPSPCFPYAYPPEKRPKVGSTLTMTRRPVGLPRHLAFSYVSVQVRDLLRKLWYSR